MVMTDPVRFEFVIEVMVAAAGLVDEDAPLSAPCGDEGVKIDAIEIMILPERQFELGKLNDTGHQRRGRMIQ